MKVLCKAPCIHSKDGVCRRKEITLYTIENHFRKFPHLEPICENYVADYDSERAMMQMLAAYKKDLNSADRDIADAKSKAETYETMVRFFSDRKEHCIEEIKKLESKLKEE